MSQDVTEKAKRPEPYVNRKFGYLCKTLKKIKPVHLTNIMLVPQYQNALNSLIPNLYDSTIFLKIREIAIKMKLDGTEFKVSKEVIRYLSKDIFDDPSFWQKPDDEVFARINEMKLNGEIE